jgi:hypothetical protein
VYENIYSRFFSFRKAEVIRNSKTRCTPARHHEIVDAVVQHQAGARKTGHRATDHIRGPHTSGAPASTVPGPAAACGKYRERKAWEHCENEQWGQRCDGLVHVSVAFVAMEDPE